MTRQEIKDKVQGTYTRALSRPGIQHYSHESIDHLFRDVRLYGREAGIDFVRTHLSEIVKQAEESAECKSGSMRLMTSGFGLAALDGMAEAIREFTGLQVEVVKSTLVVTWGNMEPMLV